MTDGNMGRFLAAAVGGGMAYAGRGRLADSGWRLAADYYGDAIWRM